MAPVHAILLHDPDYGPDDKGKLLFMGTDDRYLKIYNLNTVCDQQTIDIRDPSINSEHQIFCAGHSFLPDGRLLLAGGNWVATGCPANCNPVCVPAEDGWSSVFDPADNSFTFTGYIPGDEPPVGPYPATYYPTCTTEPDGSILVCSGLRWEDTNGDHCLDSNEQFKTKAWARYRWNEGSPSWAYADNLIGPAEADSTMVDYARMKVLPNGLFWDGRHQSPAQSYLWPWSSPASVQEHNRTSIYRETNNTVVLTLYPDDVAARVVMMCGGRNCEANQNANGEVIDYSEASPIWRSFTNSPPGNHKRRRSNTVLLPNGDLFLIGGQKYDASGYCPQGQPPMEPCGPDNGCPYTPVYECAMYSPPRNNPHLGTWRAMDTLVYPRMYHSIALMLPDGRVIVSGNQGEGQSQEGLTFELFYPPNFIKTDDSGYKNRPEIKTSGVPNYTFPASIAYGERFEIVVDEAAGAEVDTVMIMAPSSVTHANDMNQRRVVLQSFDKGLDSQGNRRIEVSGPKSEYFAPPGNYLLIVLDSDGVWSVGKVGPRTVATS